MTKENLLISNEDGIKLKIIRDRMGLSVAEFSEKTKINPSFINLLEKGCMPLPTRDKRKIREAFALEENWFDVIDISSYIQNENLPVDEACQSIYNGTSQTMAGVKNQIRLQSIVISSGDILKSIRTAAGLSRKELAEAIGITSVQIGYIETGKRTLTEKVKNKLNDYFRENSLLPQSLLVENEEIINEILNKAEQNAEPSGDDISDAELLNKIGMIKKEKGYTQTMVSEKSGVNRSQLSLIESGKMQISRRIKEKLICFIHSEGINIIGSTENTSFTASAVQELFKDDISDIVMNKNELLKMVISMKKTRDDLNKNIRMLEKVIKNI